MTIVEMGPMLMPQLRAPALSEELAEWYRAEGVEVLLETELEELTGNGRLLTGARLKDGSTIEGYLAIVGIGVVPNVELAEEAGADVDDGIIVDERFRTSLPDVYAIGDVAKYPDPTSGRMRRIEHWSNSNAQGIHLGRQLAGSNEPYDAFPVFFTQLFDRKLQVLGDVEPAVECVLRGSLADGRLIGFHLTEEHQLVGAVVHGEAADVAAELEELIRARVVVDDPTRLLDESLRPADAVGAPRLADARALADELPRGLGDVPCASMPAAASSSAGLPECGSSRTASRVTRASTPFSASAESTASPRPPSAQWSSTVTIGIRRPLNVPASIGFTE